MEFSSAAKGIRTSCRLSDAGNSLFSPAEKTVADAHALEGEGNATRVTITEYGEVYNPIFRFMSKYIMGHNGTMDGYLTALAKKFGNDVTPVDAPPVPLK